MALLSSSMLVFLVFNLLIQLSRGGDIGIYELKKGDFSIKVTNYGATVLSVMLPDRNGLFFIPEKRMIKYVNLY